MCRLECAPGTAYDPETRSCLWVSKVPSCSAQADLRAVLLGLTGPVMGLGLLTVYGLGDLIAWRWMAAISAAVPVTLAIGSRQDN